MTGRGRRPRQWRGLVGAVGALALLASACGGGGGGGTTVTYIGVAGGSISFGMTDSPTGCNPNTPSGDSPGTLTVLGAVLPSPFVVNNLGVPTANSDLIVQSELVSTKPETIVYTLNPKAVWSDGVPIAAQTVVIRRLNSHFTKKPEFKSNEGLVTARANDFDTSTNLAVFGAGRPVRKKVSSVSGQPALTFNMGRYCPIAVKWDGNPIRESRGY